MATDKPLFDTNPLGINIPTDDLFKSPAIGNIKAPAQEKIKPLTKAQKEEIESIKRKQEVDKIASGLQSMRTQPSWTNASLQRRKELYNSWYSDKYLPYLRSIDDDALRESLSALPRSILMPDIQELDKAVSGSSRLNDVWQGIKISGHNLARNLGDYLPAVAAGNMVSALDNSNGAGVRAPLLGGGAIPTSDRVKYQEIINKQLAEAAETEKDIQAAQAAQSIGQADRNVELQEDQADKGEFLGTLYNAVSNPSNLVQFATEQLPSAVPAIAAGVMAGPAGAAIAGGALTAGDAMGSAIQQVQQMDFNTLSQLPAYQELITNGSTPEDARNTLAIRAGSDGALLGAILGLATGPLGVESGAGTVARRLLSTAGNKASSQSAKRLLASGAGRLTGQSLVEGIEEGGTQLVANYAQQGATGADIDLLQGVAESAALGIIAGAPIAGMSETANTGYLLSARNKNSAPRDSASDSISTVPSAQEAAEVMQRTPTTPVEEGAQQDTDIGAETKQPTEPAADDTALRGLKLRGSQISTDEMVSLSQILVAEEANGVPSETIVNKLVELSAGLDPDIATNLMSTFYQVKRDVTTKASEALANRIDESIEVDAPLEDTFSDEEIATLEEELAEFAPDITIAQDREYVLANLQNMPGGVIVNSIINATNKRATNEQQRTDEASITSTSGMAAPAEGNPAVAAELNESNIEANNGIEEAGISGAPELSAPAPAVDDAAPVQVGGSGAPTGGAVAGPSGEPVTTTHARADAGSGIISGPASEPDQPTGGSQRPVAGAPLNSDFRPVGAAEATLVNAVTNTLSEAERAELFTELSDMIGYLPAELSTPAEVLSAAVQEHIAVETDEVPDTDILDRVSTTVSRMIKKVAATLMAIVAAINFSLFTPVNDAVAAQGTAIYNVTGTVTSPVTAVANWAAQVDSKGKSFIIADKVGGTVNIYNSRGELVHTSPALFGRSVGDAAVVGQTPAGVFTLQTREAPASYGGDIQQFSESAQGDIYAIHRVLTTNKSQKRLQRLASSTADDNRISLGCINLPADVYDKYLSKGFGGKLYVVPEQKKLSEVFKGIDRVNAKANLKDGARMPDNYTSPLATEFKSSTANLAKLDSIGETDTGADTTLLMAELDRSGADTHAGLSTDSHTEELTTASAIGLLALLRARRRKEGDDTETVEDNTATGEIKPEDVQPINDDAGPNPTPSPNEIPQQTRESEKDYGIKAKDFHRISNTPDEKRSFLQQQRGGAIASATRAAHMRFFDGDRAFIEWVGIADLLDNGGVVDEAGTLSKSSEPDDSTLVRSLKSIEPVARNKINDYADQFIKPLFDHIGKVAMRLGRSPDIVGAHLGTWVTLQHIPEANADLRNNKVKRVAELSVAPDSELFIEAMQDLLAFDNYQSGRGRQVKTAGGLTDAQARVKAAEIESYGYSQSDMQEAGRLITEAIHQLVEERVQAGVLSRDEVNEWRRKGFKWYVPLYVDKGKGGDVFTGASSMTMGKVYHREGSITPANHSLVTLLQFLNTTAYSVASRPFKENLANAYLITGGDKGLMRQNMGARFIPSEVLEARGIYHSELQYNDEGEPTRVTYKYYFDDDTILKGVQEKYAQPDLGMFTFIKTSLDWYNNKTSALLTKYNPLFAPKLWFRTAGEVAATLTSKRLYTAEGDPIPAADAAKLIHAKTFNPAIIAVLGANLLTGKFSDSKYVQVYNQMKQLGGIHTYQQGLQASGRNLQAELKKVNSKSPAAFKLLSDFFTHWNEAFSAATSVGAFMALQDLGMSVPDAVFRVQDTYNAFNRGMWTNKIRMFMPFVVPAFEGGRNLVRNLSTSRGRAVMGAKVLMGAAAYSLLSAVSPDDEDKGDLLDSMSLGEISRFMPLFSDSGDYAKLPVAFGMSRVAWVLGAGLNRLSRGAGTVGELISEAALVAFEEIQPTDFAPDMSADDFVTRILFAIMPAAVTPAAQVALNTNAFGGNIHGSKAREAYASESGRGATPTIWTDIATSLEKYAGVDMYPESLRHLATSYLVGPLQGIVTFMEQRDKYMQGDMPTTRQELGPVWDAVGASQFWDNGSMHTKRAYFRALDEGYGILRKYRVTESKAGTKPGQKMTRVKADLLSAGATYQEIEIALAAVTAESERQKNNRELKKKADGFKKDQLRLEYLAPEYARYVNSQDVIMRNLLRTVRENRQ